MRRSCWPAPATICRTPGARWRRIAVALGSSQVDDVDGDPANLGSPPDVLDLVASGKFDPTLVTARVSGWADAPEAFLDCAPANFVVARADVHDAWRCSGVEVGAL
jgi:hypothetical protein